jgi:VanZ family protein
MPLRRLILPVFWATAVFSLGSSHFGAEQTRVIVRPLLRRLAPTATPAVLEAVHAVLRKLAHLGEYGILARLWFGTLLTRVGRTPRRASWLALAICLTCAFVDEAHQAMLLTRVGSARDVVVDATGTLAVLIVSRTRREASERRMWLGAAAPEAAE